MTQDEILETRNVIAAIGDGLRLIEGITDPEKLASIAKETAPQMYGGLLQLSRLLWSTVPQPGPPDEWPSGGRAESVSRVLSAIEYNMLPIIGLTEMLERPEKKAKLVEVVAKNGPRMRSALNEVNLLL